MWGLPFDAVVGSRLRSTRQTLLLPADAVAAAARWLGLKWHRSTVATIEKGERSLSAAEFLLLPEILRTAHLQHYGYESEAAIDLLWFVGSTSVALAPGFVATPAGIESILRNTPVGIGDFSNPIATQEHLIETFQMLDAASGVPDELRDLVPAAHRLAAGDTERAVARRLGRSAVQVAVAALHLWGRGIAEERDKRIHEAGGPAGRGARSQATRRLIDELRPVVETFPMDDNTEETTE